MYNKADVYVVQKQTTLERYTRGSVNVDICNTLERDEHPEPLRFAHEEHKKSLSILLNCLNKYNLSFEVFNLDEIIENKISYFDELKPESGFHPVKKLVISLGGDGTLLHASHHVGHDIELIGINSCPEYSVGHMCPVMPTNIEKSIENFVTKKMKKTSLVRRLKLNISSGNVLPLALNDVLLCNRHPAATSRYQLSIFSLDQNEKPVVEKQLSSGLWISTAAGRTAAISSYNFPHAEISSSNILVAAREPYDNTKHREELKLKKFSIDGDKKGLTFYSRMRQGLVCVDGPDFSANLGYGENVTLTSPPECALKLVTNPF